MNIKLKSNCDFASPIKINIENNYIFESVAIFLDQLEFLKEVFRIRKDLQITQLVNYNNLKMYKVTASQKGNFHSLLFDLTKEKEYKEWETYNKLTHDGIEYLLQKFQKSSAFYDIIKFSIICGEVHQLQFNNEPRYILDTNLPIQINLDIFESAFLIYPETTKKQLLDAFYEYKTGIKKSNSKDFLSRDRDWYWMNNINNENRLGYQKIANIYGSITKEAVGIAIKNYQKKINSYLQTRV